MTRSRLTSRAAALSGYRQRAFVQQGIAAAASASSFGIMAARENARINSYTDPGNILTAADAGDGTATITMIVHTRIYPVEGGIDVPDLVFPAPVNLLGAPLATHGFVYHDDTTLQNTAPVLVFTTVEKEAQVGYAPGRHYDGEITTPAAAAPPTSGSGGAGTPGSFKQLP